MDSLFIHAIAGHGRRERLEEDRFGKSVAAAQELGPIVAAASQIERDRAELGQRIEFDAHAPVAATGGSNAEDDVATVYFLSRELLEGRGRRPRPIGIPLETDARLDIIQQQFVNESIVLPDKFNAKPPVGRGHRQAGWCSTGHQARDSLGFDVGGVRQVMEGA